MSYANVYGTAVAQSRSQKTGVGCTFSRGSWKPSRMPTSWVQFKTGKITKGAETLPRQAWKGNDTRVEGVRTTSEEDKDQERLGEDVSRTAGQ